MKKDNEIYTYKLKSGAVRYGFKTYLGIDPATGKARKATRQGFKTYKEAKNAKIRLKAERPKPEKKKITVDEMKKQWFEMYEKTVKQTTAHAIDGVYKNHIKNKFGDMYVQAITPAMLQSWANDLQGKYLKYKVITRTLERILRYAVYLDYLDYNPFNKVIFPKPKGNTKRHENYYEIDELKDFLNATKSTDSFKHYVFFLALASLGLRKSEALALRWTDIDFENDTVSITKTITQDRHGSKTLGKPKTKSSNRTLPLSDNLRTELLEYRKTCIYNDDQDFIFAATNGGLTDPSEPNRWLKAIYAKNPGLKQITVHGFRHTLATLLYDGNENITPKDVQLMLGHSKITTALNIYTHVTQKQKNSLKQSINNLNL